MRLLVHMKVVVLFIMFTISPASAAPPFDVDGDGQEGLPEAIHALQVTSGLAETAVLAGYDLAEYMWIDGGEYLMEFHNFYANTHGSVLNSISRVPQGGGIEQIIRSVQNGGTKYYYSITPTEIHFQGQDISIDQYREYHYRYMPAAVQGLRNMAPGDVFSAVYQREYICVNQDYQNPPCDLVEQPYHVYVEYTFTGLDTVTVPAGTFNDCIKIVRKIFDTYGSNNNVGIEIYYYAKNVGLVKWISPDVNSELSYAKVGSQTYPNSSSIVIGQGNWNDSVAGTNGQFYLSFNPDSSPIYTTFTLDDFQWNDALQAYERRGYFLKSTDGINFVPDPGYYDVNNHPPAPNLTLAVENNTITGTLDTAILSGSY